LKTKQILSTATLLGAVGILGSAPMFAHHSFAAEYDVNKPVTVKGTVTKVEWANPHILFYMDTKDESGKVSNWQCEGGPPNALVRMGWTPKSLKPGDEITVEGFGAKDGSTTLSFRSVTLPDGRTVFSGTAEEGTPKGKGDSK
jgi:hypothetical protein